MHRTQIQLEEWQYELLLREAESAGTSLAHQVRVAVSRYLEARRRPEEGQRLSSIAGIAEDATATAADHDHVLYDRAPGSGGDDGTPDREG